MDANANEMILLHNSIMLRQQKIRFSMDGWVGRYGMPIEFLIATHISTMMPDLSYQLVTGFNTNINIHMKLVNGVVNSYYKSRTTDNYIPYGDVRSLNPNNGYDLAKLTEMGVYPARHENGCKCVLEEDLNGVKYYSNIDTSCAMGLTQILKDMKKSSASKYETYVPYIADVTNHWFRDIYYVVDLENENSKELEFVNYDSDYESIYRDRWTLYEAFSDADVANGLNPDLKGNHKLFLLDDLGNYVKEEDVAVESFSNNNVVVDPEGTGYYVYYGTVGDAKNDGFTVAKKAITSKVLELPEDYGKENSEDGDNNDNTLDPEEEKLLEEATKTADTLFDLGWNYYKKSKIWSAYRSTEKIEDNQFSSATGVDSSRIYVKKASTYNYIKQTGEAQRTQTNPKIKKIFLENTYFRYDGNAKTAEIITALRKKIKEDQLGEDGIEYGPLNALELNDGTIDVTDLHYKASELGLEVKNEKDDKDYYISDFSGQVSLNQDSLNIFSMLENTHTLDADYVYRDFKELVVELGLFSKEELTDEVPEILAWPIPDVGSLGYPYRNIDKQEMEFGTLIHSKRDIDVEKRKDDELIKYSQITYLYDGDGKGGIQYDKERKDEVKFNFDFTTEELLEATDNIHTILEEEKWTYANDGYITFEKARKGNKTVDSSSYICWVLQEVGIITKGWYENIDGILKCSEFKNFILTRETAGEIVPGDILVMDAEHSPTGIAHIQINGRNNIQYYCSSTESVQEKPHRDRSFIDITEDGFNYTYVIRLLRNNLREYEGYNGNEAVVSPVTGILLEYGTYDGKEKNAITGETYRENIDFKYTSNDGEEQKVSDNVGYAKILVLDAEYYKVLETSTENRWKKGLDKDALGNTITTLVNENGSFYEALVDDKETTAKEKINGVYENDTDSEDTDDEEESEFSSVSTYNAGTFKKKDINSWSDLDISVYGYKEFAERYEEAGIAGYIIYIDGFVCEIPDKEVGYKESAIDEIPYPNGAGTENTISIDDENNTYCFKNYTPKDFDDMYTFKKEKKGFKSKFFEEPVYDTQSISINHKLEAEMQAKVKAVNSLYLDENISTKIRKINDDGTIEREPVIFIKEGTVIGRTMTDKELLESDRFRDSKYGTFEEYREYSIGKNHDGADKLIGNYMRIIMRDTDNKIVTDVEDYMKLNAKREFDWFELLYWAPFECGAIDKEGGGPQNVSSCTPGEIAVGLMQWTDLVPHYHANSNGSANTGKRGANGSGGGINLLLHWLIREDSLLCEPLKDVADMSTLDRWCDAADDYLNVTPAPILVEGMVDENGDYIPFNEYKYSVLNTQVIQVIDENYVNEDGTFKDNVKEVYFTLLGSYDIDGADGRMGRYDPCMKMKPQKFYLTPDSAAPIRINCRYNDHMDLKRYCFKAIGRSRLYKALTAVCHEDREEFFWMQVKYMKQTIYNKMIKKWPWLADRPECVQAEVLHQMIGGGIKEDWLYNEAPEWSDEKILEYYKYCWSERSSTAADASHDPTKGRPWYEPEIGLAILEGRLSSMETEEWVRTGNSTICENAGVEFRHGNGW